MNHERYWKLFEKTGNINDYLNYTCTCEKNISDNTVPKYSLENEYWPFEEYGAKLSEEGGHSDKPGNHNGNGSIGNANR